MKYSQIGLVALAAVLVAGCGGGSDNGSSKPAGPFEVDLSKVANHGLTAGAVYTVEKGKTLDVGVSGGTTTLSCPDTAGDAGCEFKVSKDDKGEYIAMSTGAEVGVKFNPRPTGSTGSTGDSAAVRRAEQAQAAAEAMAAAEKRRADEEEKSRKKAEADAAAAQRRADKPRAEALVELLATNNTADLANPTASGARATVNHERDETPAFSIPNRAVPERKPAILTSWRGFEFSARGDSPIGDKAYLYTNLDAPTASGAKREFWKVYGIGTDGVIDVTSPSGTPERLTATEGSASLQITGTPIAFLGDTRESSSPTFGGEFDRLEIVATFGGTRGRLICTDCTGDPDDDSDGVDSFFSRSDDGKPDFKNGTWDNFKPDSLIALHDRDHDETYLYFGYWMERMRDAADPGFGWIYGGSTERSDVSITAGNLTGTATYTGRAVGQYAINTPNPGAVSEVGAFTATATLDADFSGSGTLSGTINGFSDKAWILKLEQASLSDASSGSGMIAADSTSEIGGVPVSGNWGATVHGIDNHSEATDANKPAGAKCPNGCRADVAGVAGWFRASGNNITGVAVGEQAPAVVSIAGAFAAD